LFYGSPIYLEETAMIFDEIARELDTSGVDSKDIFAILSDISASMEGLGDGDLRPTLMKIVVGCIAAIQHLDRRSKRACRMFYIVGDRISVAERGDGLWKIDEGAFDSYDDAIRGHVDETGVYFHEIDDEGLGELLPRIAETMMISIDLDVFVGVPGKDPRRVGKAADWL
jgi:hypothetical protein